MKTIAPDVVEGVAPSNDRASYRDLLSSLVNQVSSLVKGEIALVQAELRDELRTFLSAAAVLALSFGFGLLAAMSLAAAAIVALSSEMSTVAACAVVGVVFGLAAVALATYGLKQMKR